MEEITEVIARDTQSYHPDISAMVSAKSTDPHIFLWPMGAGYLGIMDLQRMEYDRVYGLGGLVGEKSLAHMMLAAQNGSKVLSIAHKEEGNNLYVSFWQKIEAGKRITRSAEYIYPKRRPYFTQLTRYTIWRSMQVTRFSCLQASLTSTL